MRCPKCSTDVDPREDSCWRCGYVVGMRSLEPQEATERNPRFGPDAVIVGKLGNPFESFLSDRTEDFWKQPRTTAERGSSSSAPSQIYVDAELKELLLPDAVLERAGKLDVARLTPLERKVYDQIDGVAPVAFVLTRAEVSADDLCLAVALLVDKSAIRKKTMGGPDKTAPMPRFKAATASSDTERNPVWSPSATAADAPKDVSLLHELVVKKLRASGLPVPGDPRVPTTKVVDARDTLPGPTTGAGSSVGSQTGAGVVDEVRRLWADAAEAEARGDAARCIQLLRDAVVLRPDDATLLNRLGVVLAAHAKDFAGARAALERAVELMPDNPAYANNLRRVRAAMKTRRGGPESG